MLKNRRTVILQGDADELASEENEFWKRFGDKIRGETAEREFHPAGSRYSLAYVSITFIVQDNEIYRFDDDIKEFYRDMGYNDYDSSEEE